MSGWRDALRFLLLGATSLTIQTLLVREALFAFHGGEVALGLLFAVWLASIALGARVGSLWARGERGERRAYALGPAGLALLPWLGILAVFLFRHHRLWLPVEAGGYLAVGPYALLLLGVALPAGGLTGLLFPLLLRIGRSAPGTAYGLEAFGSMAGGAIASWLALPRIPALTLLALWAIACALGALPGGSGDDARRSARERSLAVGAAGALALAAILSGAIQRLDDSWIVARWQALGTGTTLRVSRETPYHQVSIAERAGETSLYLDGLYLGGLADPYEDSLEAAVILTQHPGPAELLLIAPALFGPARILAETPRVRTTLLRADERLDRLVARELGAPGEAATRIGRDPREAARAWGASGDAQRFDLIALLQGGAVSGAGNRLYTREFLADCARLLRPGGVLALTIPGTANVASPEGDLVRASIAGALREAFGDVRVAPGMTHHLFAARPRAANAPASVSPLSWDPDTLAARRARIWPAAEPWPPQLFARLWPRERVEALQAQIDRTLAAGAPLNRDRRPIAYFAQIRLWDRFSGSPLAGFLSSWHRRPWVWSAGFLGLLAAVGLGLRRRHGPAAASLAGTGLAGMGTSLLLLFLYQTTCGTLYLDVGLLVALTMAGLGAGALLGSRWRPRGRRAVAWSDLAWVLFLLAWLPLLGWLPRISAPWDRWLLLGLAAIAGMLTALPFPWVAAHLAERTACAASLGGRSGLARRAEDRAASGGLADAIDHAGALCGALATGTLLVPLLGFDATLALFAAVKVLGALGWLGAGGGSP